MKAESVHPPVSAAVKLRVVVRLLTARNGTKMAVARGLAVECGRSPRGIFHWRETFKKHGPAGLVRAKRSDSGTSHIYSELDFGRVIAASDRLRRHPRSKIVSEWKALKLQGLPGSYETFRSNVRALQAARWRKSA